VPTHWGELQGNLTDQEDLQEALDLKADDADLTSHTSNTSNPHSVTKAQVGLSNVDNTTDANKPVSTLQQAALDLKADEADLASHTSSTSNPHSVTKAQVGLGNVDNTSDANKPVSTAQQTALDLKADDADLASHTSSTSNPHSVTKAQVGLGNVDNTSDANKPVSTAQQTAFDLKADKTNVLQKDNITSYTPSSDYHPATRKFVEDQIAALDKATPMGLLDCSGNPNYPAGTLGDYYYVSVAGKVGGASGPGVEFGDKIQCIVDSAGGDHATVGSSWMIYQGNLDKATTSDAQSGTNDNKYLTPAKGYD